MLKTENVKVVVSPDERKMIQAQATREDRSISSLIRRVVVQYVKDQTKKARP